MIKAILTDFSRVLLAPTDESYTGGLNDLHKKLSAQGDYNFWEHFRLNEPLLNFFRTLNQEIGVYVFTTEFIQELPALQPRTAGIFRGIFSAARLGLKKNDPATYKTIAAKIHLKPEEVLYLDDKPSNGDAALKAGMSFIHYQSNDQAINAITQKTLI